VLLNYFASDNGMQMLVMRINIMLTAINMENPTKPYNNTSDQSTVPTKLHRKKRKERGSGWGNILLG